MKCHPCAARQLQALRSWLIQSSTAGKIRETQLTASSSACIPRVSRYVLLILVSCLGITALSGCGSPPQVLTDEAVFGELDALYTAVTSKRRNLMEDCQKRITKLHDEQRMSDAGFEEIEAIIALAEQDKWTPAAERLYAFMRGQRKAE
jgi:hypothetical protein